MVHATNRKAVSIVSTFITLGCTLSLISCASSHSTGNQNQSLENPQSLRQSDGPALWRIQDSDTDIFIFGAIEIAPKGSQWRTDIIDQALENANIVVLETNEGPETQTILAQRIPQIGLYNDGRTLSAQLTPDEQSRAQDVTTNFGIPLNALDPLKPWLASVQLGALNAQKQGYQDWLQIMQEINNFAKSQEIPVQYLEETRVDLLETINALPESTHKKMFLTTVRQLSNEIDLLSIALPAWIKGDTHALGKLYHAEEQWADDILYEALLVNRNRQWVSIIKTMLKEEKGSIFFTVGTGHVVGPDSLIKMLEEDGLKPIRQ